MDIQIGGLIGLTFGIISALIGIYAGKKQAEKNRGNDEISKAIWKNARAKSWYVTLVIIYLFLILSLLGVSISTISMLSVLLVVHLFSWAIVGSYLSFKMYNESKADRQIFTFLITFFIIIGVAMIIFSFILS